MIAHGIFAEPTAKGKTEEYIIGLDGCPAVTMPT